MKLQKKIYETKAEKKRDFIIGLVLFLSLNVIIGLLALLATYLSMQVESDIEFYVIMGFYYILPFLVNIGLLVYFIFTRTWIALGMLGTFGGLMLLAVVLGVIASVVCFVLVVTGKI